MTHFDDFFDKIYIITKEHNKKKRNNIKNYFKKQSIEFEFFDKIDYNFISCVKSILSNDGIFLDEFDISYYYTIYSIITMSKCLGYKNVLIIDEDVILLNDFKVKASKVLKSLPVDWDIFNLHNNLFYFSKYSEFTNNERNVFSTRTSKELKAFAVNSKYYNKFLKYFDDKIQKVDDILKLIDCDFYTKIYSTYPNLCLPSKNIQEDLNKYITNFNLKYEDFQI